MKKGLLGLAVVGALAALLWLLVATIAAGRPKAQAASQFYACASWGSLEPIVKGNEAYLPVMRGTTGTMCIDWATGGVWVFARRGSDQQVVWVRTEYPLVY